jgi:hypothetical protein
MRHKKTQTARGWGTGAADLRRNAGATDVQLHCSKFPSPCQSPIEEDLQELNLMAQRAKATGDRDGYWAFRRAYLLAQAAAYTGGVQ